MTNESKTLYIPLYGKAMMSREGFFDDKTAEHIVDTCGHDFSDVDDSKRLAIYMAMRAMRYDELAEKFIEKHRNCIVIHLGCGLDSRCKRLKCMPKMWYDLDFPEVIDLRTLSPWDKETVLASVKKTGHAVVAHEAVRQGGFGAEISATIAEEDFTSLKAPVVRIGGPFVPTPMSPHLEDLCRTLPVNIGAAVKQAIGKA